VSRSASASNSTQANELIARLNGRPVVLIGMMGAGKSTVGRKLAARLGRKFIDCDKEIEAAANMSIPDFFATHGEAEFRAGEQRVISRILKDPDTVVATGGGAFMSEETRDLIAEQAVSVWINADADLLLARVSRRSNRPLLNTADPRVTLQKLIDERYPVYALANVTVTSRDVPQDAVAADIVGLLLDWTLTGSSPSQDAGQTADAR
jgi:shikimate kinase